MRFIIENLVSYSLLIEAAKDEFKRPKINDARREACESVLTALKADFDNMRKALGRSANRKSPLVENANIYLTAKELKDFARSQEDVSTERFCRVTMFGAVRLIGSRLAQELGRENLTSTEEQVVFDILDESLEAINEEANDAYQQAQF